MMELIVAYLFYWNVTCLIFCLHYILTTDLPWIKYAKMPRWKKRWTNYIFRFYLGFSFLFVYFSKSQWNWRVGDFYTVWVRLCYSLVAHWVWLRNRSSECQPIVRAVWTTICIFSGGSEIFEGGGVEARGAVWRESNFRTYYLEIALLCVLGGVFLNVYIPIFACWFMEVNSHVCVLWLVWS